MPARPARLTLFGRARPAEHRSDGDRIRVAEALNSGLVDFKSSYKISINGLVVQWIV